MRIDYKRTSIFLYVTVGSVIISTAILHATYTMIFPLLSQVGLLIIFFSAFFIGLLIPEFKDALIAMFLSIFLTLLIMGIFRSLPVLLGIIISDMVFFIISQFALSIPLMFPLIMVYTLGTLAGLIFSAFAFDPYTKDL
ncbi:MAG: hypothetical protein ACFE8O_00610 [Candidatus Hermodarchaeota archaeon]